VWPSERARVAPQQVGMSIRRRNMWSRGRIPEDTREALLRWTGTVGPRGEAADYPNIGRATRHGNHPGEVEDGNEYETKVGDVHATKL
jgi:hypothetical protein